MLICLNKKKHLCYSITMSSIQNSSIHEQVLPTHWPKKENDSWIKICWTICFNDDLIWNQGYLWKSGWKVTIYMYITMTPTIMNHSCLIGIETAFVDSGFSCSIMYLYWKSPPSKSYFLAPQKPIKLPKICQSQ